MSEPLYVTEARRRSMTERTPEARNALHEALALWAAGKRNPGDDPHPDEDLTQGN